MPKQRPISGSLINKGSIMKKVIVVLSFLLGTSAFANGQMKCHTDKFPEGIGSDLTLTIGNSGYPTHATMILNDQGPIGKTNGEFDVADPVPNEDGNLVNYLSWYAGAGLGQDGGAHLALIPSKMVIYAFKENYSANKSLFLGVINWQPGQKVETLFNLTCQGITP